jgi:CspA family cold shock protein
MRRNQEFLEPQQQGVTMPVGRVKWYSLEKGFGFIASDESEDVYLASSALPAGVATVKPGTKLEFSIIEGRRGPQAHAVHVLEEPASVVANTRANADDLATMIEDTIKILDKVGNGIRHGRHPSGPDAERLAKVLRGIASQIEG